MSSTGSGDQQISQTRKLLSNFGDRVGGIKKNKGITIAWNLLSLMLVSGSSKRDSQTNRMILMSMFGKCLTMLTSK